MRSWMLLLALCATACGQAGPMGAEGPQGAIGMTGPKGDPGAPGLVATRGFDAENVLPSLAANTTTVPAPCQTESYTAGANEVALIDFDSSVYPQTAPLAIIAFKAAAQIDGAPFTAISTESVDSLQDGTANAAIHKQYPLSAGKKYVFGISWYSVTATGALTKATCHGTVMVARM